MRYSANPLLSVSHSYILQKCDGSITKLENAFPGTSPYLFKDKQWAPGTVFAIQTPGARPAPIIINVFAKNEEDFKKGLTGLIDYFVGTEESVRIAVSKMDTEYMRGLVQFEKKMNNVGIATEVEVYV